MTLFLGRCGSLNTARTRWRRESSPSAPGCDFYAIFAQLFKESCLLKKIQCTHSLNIGVRLLGRFALKTLPQKRESPPQIRTNASANLDAYRGYFWRLGQIGSQPGLTGKKEEKNNVLVGRSSFMGTATADKNSRCSCKGSTGSCRLDRRRFFLGCCTDRNKCKVRRECGWGEGRLGERGGGGRDAWSAVTAPPSQPLISARKRARSGAVRRCSRWAD